MCRDKRASLLCNLPTETKLAVGCELTTWRLPVNEVGQRMELLHSTKANYPEMAPFISFRPLCQMSNFLSTTLDRTM